MTKTLGQRIRELREEADLSLRELAHKLKLSPAFVSDIELGRRYPSEEVLAAFASLLHTTVKEMKQYDTRPPVEEIRRLSNADPAIGLAFRKVVESGVTADDLMKLADKLDREKKNG